MHPPTKIPAGPFHGMLRKFRGMCLSTETCGRSNTGEIRSKLLAYREMWKPLKITLPLRLEPSKETRLAPPPLCPSNLRCLVLQTVQSTKQNLRHLVRQVFLLIVGVW